MSQTHSTRVVIGKKPESALWADVFKRELPATDRELREQGFLPIGEIAERLGMSRPGATTWCEKRKFEKRTGRVPRGRNCIYFRPCTSASE